MTKHFYQQVILNCVLYPSYCSVNAFEYTSECIVFDLLSISLYHGWLVDTSAPDTMNAVGSLTYNQLVEKIIENTGSTDGEKSSQGKYYI